MKEKCIACDGAGVVPKRSGGVQDCVACSGVCWNWVDDVGYRLAPKELSYSTLLYQKWVASMWFQGFGDDIEAPLSIERDLPIMGLGIGGEAGEVQELIKKYIRDGVLDKEKLKKELGDTLYYLSQIGNFFGIRLDEIAFANIEKCEGRLKRGTRRGSGDDR